MVPIIIVYIHKTFLFKNTNHRSILPQWPTSEFPPRQRCENWFILHSLLPKAGCYDWHRAATLKIFDKRMKWWQQYFKVLWKYVMKSMIYSVILKGKGESEVIPSLDCLSPIGIKGKWKTADIARSNGIKLCQLPSMITTESSIMEVRLVTYSSTLFFFFFFLKTFYSFKKQTILSQIFSLKDRCTWVTENSHYVTSQKSNRNSTMLFLALTNIWPPNSRH